MSGCQIIVPHVENALQTQIQSISIAVPEMTPNIMLEGMQCSTKGLMIAMPSVNMHTLYSHKLIQCTVGILLWPLISKVRY